MGMLAAASSDGNVHVYSLPFPEELKFEETEEHKLVLILLIAQYSRILITRTNHDSYCSHNRDSTVLNTYSNTYH